MEKMTTIKLIFITILCLSILLNVALGFFCFKIISNLEENQKAEKTNHDILFFANMFVEKVLMADSDVDFDTRLELETSVRNLNDKEIFDQWQKFTKSQTDPEAQEEVSNLFLLLFNKISY
jgi:hypothetical protein